MAIWDMIEEHIALYGDGSPLFDKIEKITNTFDDIEELYHKETSQQWYEFNCYDVFYLNGKTPDQAVGDSLKTIEDVFCYDSDTLMRVPAQNPDKFNLNGKLLYSATFEEMLNNIYANNSNEAIKLCIERVANNLADLIGTNQIEYYLIQKESDFYRRAVEHYPLLLGEQHYIVAGDYCILHIFGTSE